MDAPTLENIARRARTVSVWCVAAGCGHRSRIPIADLIAWLAPDLPFKDLAAHLWCSHCGEHDATCQPDWPDPVSERQRA